MIGALFYGGGRILFTDLMRKFVRLEVIVVFMKDTVRMRASTIRLTGFEDIDIHNELGSEEAVYMAQFPKCPKVRVRACKPSGKLK